MPNKYELTQEEKEKIIQRNHQLVDEFNQYLPDELKLTYATDLETRLNDEAEVKHYRILEQIQKGREKQEEIYRGLIKKFGEIPEDKLLLARSFKFGLKTEDTKEAREYNEKLYKEYRDDPDKVFYQRYKNILEFNPQNILNIIDDDQKIAEFYLNNQRLVEDSFVFVSAMNNSNLNPNPTLKKAVNAISRGIERTLSYPMSIVKAQMGMEYFSFPKLTSEQSAIIFTSNPDYMREGSPLREKLNGALTDLGKKDIKDFYNTVNNKGYKLGNNFFLKYVAYEENPETHKIIEIPLDDGIKKEGNNPNIHVRERTNEEIYEMKRINKAFDKEYINIWKRNFSNNYDKKEFDFNRIKNANKGGFFERFIGMFKRTTSRQYQEFITAFKEYHDPKSPNYRNNDNLKTKAQAYSDYKTERGVSFSKLDATGRGRLMLTSAVVKTINEMEKNKMNIATEIYGTLKEERVGEPFLDKNVVDDNLVNNNIIENEIKAPQLENENELNK